MIRTPRCPGCDSEPMQLGLPAGLTLAEDQAFCPNDDCHVLNWDPTKTIAENAAGMTQVDLSGLDLPRSDGSER